MPALRGCLHGAASLLPVYLTADALSMPHCLRSSPAGSVLLLRELDRQARQEGGAVYMLNGNHESLNVAGDFR